MERQVNAKNWLVVAGGGLGSYMLHFGSRVLPRQKGPLGGRVFATMMMDPRN
jgi:hypothetical protein